MWTTTRAILPTSDRCRFQPGRAAYVWPGKVIISFRRSASPRLPNIQQELKLVDAGTIKGYRVAYWYLLKEGTDALDPKRSMREQVQSIDAVAYRPRCRRPITLRGSP